MYSMKETQGYTTLFVRSDLVWPWEFGEGLEEPRGFDFQRSFKMYKMNFLTKTDYMVSELFWQQFIYWLYKPFSLVCSSDQTCEAFYFRSSLLLF